MASEYDIDCPVCGASVKGESLLKHLRKYHKLDEASVKAEYSKVSRFIKRKPRRSNFLKVRCVSCDVVLLHNNIPEHVKRVHKHESTERQDMIKTQSRVNLVNLQAVDVQPQGLVEPQVPSAPVNVDNVNVDDVTAEAQPQELVERQVRPAPVNVVVDTNQESDCPMCPARLKDVRYHLQYFHGKTNEEIKTILTGDQRRRAHLQLTYKTSEIFGALEQLPERQGECYTGEGLVAMGSVIDLLRRLGVNIHQDVGPPVVGTRAHKSVPNQPQIDNAFLVNLIAAALQQPLSTEPDGQIPGTSVAPENPQSDMDEPDTQAPTSVEQPTENTDDNDSDSDNESLKPLSSRIVERDNLHSSEMDDSDSQEPDDQISSDQSSIKVEVRTPLKRCSVMIEDIQSPPKKRIRFDQQSGSEPRTTPSRAAKKRDVPQYSSSGDDSDSDRDSSVRVSKSAKSISSSSQDFDSDGVTGGSTDDDSDMEPSGAINNSSPSKGRLENDQEMALKGGNWRGRGLLSQIRDIRQKAGLYEEVPWEEGDDSLISKFHDYLTNRSYGNPKHNMRCAKIVAKMMYFCEPEGPTLDDYVKAITADKVDKYFHRISQDLDLTGRGIGIQPSAVKNELRPAKMFIEMLNHDVVFGDSYYITKIQMTMRLAAVLDTLTLLEKRNQKAIGETMKQKHIKKSREGMKFHPIDKKKCFSNPEVDDKIKQIIADENNKSSANRRVTDQKKYSFFLGYLITRLSLNHFQRSGAVGGMTVEEFKGGIQQSVPLEFGERYLIQVAEHKNKHNMPASFFIDEFEKKLVTLYLKQYRPDSESEKVFLMLRKGSEIENASKITSEFQAKYDLAKVSPTDMRHALVQIVALCPEEAKSEADISAIGNQQTARSHNSVEIAAFTTRKQIECVHRMIQKTAHMSLDILGNVYAAPGISDTDPQQAGSVVEVAMITSDTVPPQDDGGDDAASVASPVSSAGTVGSRQMRVRRVKDTLKETHPVTEESKCPGVKDVMAAIAVVYPGGLDKSENDHLKINVVGSWREEQHRARAYALSQRVDLRGVTNREILGHARTEFPHWGNFTKVAGSCRRYANQK